ncbi:hypothetical protein LCGC14_1494360 [marine sediment metagenome]|uniref:HK97 gp10 family phage protein n=1 Tax=marine sediment metagenome TaxID=412755 RepID=A0A0F9JRR0_9ZZZZ
MVMNIKIMGNKRMNNFVLKILKNTEKEIMKSSREFIRFIQRSAKLRAPRETGKLAKSIVVKRGRKIIKIIVDSPYGIFQEEGFTPHWIHTSMSDRVGGTVGGFIGRKGFIFVRRFKPFIKPALAMGLSRLPMLMNRAMEKSVAKSRR